MLSIKHLTITFNEHNITCLLELQVQLKYTHQMSFIGYLNSNAWKSDWTNNDVCNFTWSRDQTHMNSQSWQAVHAWTIILHPVTSETDQMSVSFDQQYKINIGERSGGCIVSTLDLYKFVVPESLRLECKGKELVAADPTSASAMKCNVLQTATKYKCSRKIPVSV